MVAPTPHDDTCQVDARAVLLLGQLPVNSPAVRTAPAPFDDTSADVVLRTSDNVDFHVFRWFLKGISPFFDDLFALPQPHGSIRTDPIMMSEPSTILEVILRLHYPFPEPPTFSSFDDAKPVLTAAHKLQLTRIAPTLHEATLPHIRVDPVRAYGFALRHEMEDLARLAAYEFLALRDVSVFTTMTDSDELENMSVAAYRRLLIYRETCIARIQAQVPQWKLCGPWTWNTCSYCVKHELFGFPDACCLGECSCGPATWFMEHRARVQESLRTRPSIAVLKEPALISKTLASDTYRNCQGWGSCKTQAYEYLQRYTEKYIRDVEGCIREVQLEIK